MPQYQLTWITNHLAVGYAPMSLADLDSIKAQEINAIVNLCGEFCDLHEIQEQSGFEVFYLPIPDESAPDMEEMEKALAWLDEAIYLGKNVLVHCRFGIGRTGTFVTAFLIRKGLGMKLATKRMKGTRANPASYRQWRLIKKYSKKAGKLTIREPSLESKNIVDLSTFFNDYEALVRKIETDIEAAKKRYPRMLSCGYDTDGCCYRYFDIELIEAIYLNNRMNCAFKSDFRLEIIHSAVAVGKGARKFKRQYGQGNIDDGKDAAGWIEAYSHEKNLCPLNIENRCSLYSYRPISCRIHHLPEDCVDQNLIRAMLQELSRNIFFSFSGFFLESENLVFTVADTVSGKFVQQYFYCLANLQQHHKIAEVKNQNSN